MSKHRFFEKEDAGVPRAILDSNGDIVLGLCKACGQGEGDLEDTCPAFGVVPHLLNMERQGSYNYECYMTIEIEQLREALKSAAEATGKQQVGEVQGDESPMAKMAAALRGKAEAEKAAFDQRVQSGEWGPMPDAGTQADFCQLCDGSGWDGESREKKCQSCSGEGLAARQPGTQLAVWCGPMPESNGRQNWTTMLYRKGGDIFREGSMQIERSEYPDRVRYEADRLRYLIGERDEEPDIMKYDANLHSGYVEPPAQGIDLGQFIALAKFGEEFAFSAEKQPHSRVVYSQASRLLALIGQCDAAPGVGP